MTYPQISRAIDALCRALDTSSVPLAEREGMQDILRTIKARAYEACDVEEREALVLSGECGRLLAETWAVV